MSENYTNGHRAQASPPSALQTPVREPIALIGIGCRFPGGANDPAAFWKLLTDGVDAIREVPPERWNRSVFYDPQMGKPGKSHACWGGFIDGIDQFDPHFFGISPREAGWMDPQQRLLLEAAWEALEDGGQVLEWVAGSKTAVFVGISSWEYSFAQISFRDRATIDGYTNTGGALSIAANRISYSFDLRGPSVAVDTACSSALVATHLACKSIWEEGCPLALAGGVNALLLPDWYVSFSRLGMLSPDGRCRAFDSRGNGFVRGEGVGMVVLKPLARALADGDRIYAVIRGSAVNQDGRTPGLTVPNEEAQEALLRQAYQNAGVAPSQVDYIEAHGTGTPVGDPIEAQALGRVLSASRAADRPCLVGSVKTNIGHLEAGSGAAGLIKTALALYHRTIPGNLHFLQPNPAIDFEQLRLRVPVRAESWPRSDGPASAGVNSFGYGGTNAHVVLQEAPRTGSRIRSVRPSNGLASSSSGPVQLLPLSARSSGALRQLAGSWKGFVSGCPPEVRLHELAWNAAHRRSHHDHRLALVAHSREELVEQLAAFADGGTLPGVSTERSAGSQRPRVAFVCAGQGPQWWAMGRQLLEQEPVFREVIQRCDEIIRGLGPWSLLAELTADEGQSRMHVTAISQPAIFALQAGLAAVWRSWGVQPSAVAGHSVGEVAAAYLAGVFSLEDAVRVIYQRGRCMELAPGRGRMLAAGISADEARRLLEPYGERVSLAAVNSPASVTLSGEAGPLEAIARVLEERQVFVRFLHVQYAFHSAQMDPIREELLSSLADLRPRPATLPLFSSVSGRRIDGPEMGAEYWWRNVRQTVQWAAAVDHLAEMGCDTVVELSPHPVLTASVAECYQQRGKKVCAVPSLRRREEERATLLRSLGQLYTLGYPVNWSGVTRGYAQPLALPRYPWQHERLWSESEESRQSRLTPVDHPLLGASLRAPVPSWDARLDLRLVEYLADHRVQRTIIVPATAYLEMALAAARRVQGEGPTELENVRLANPCFLSMDRPLRTHVAFNPEDGTVRMNSRPIGSEDAWTLHCSVQLRSQPASPGCAGFSADRVQQRCPRTYSRDECYRYFQKLGLSYGPLFQGIEQSWQGDREALSVVRLPEPLVAGSADYRFHPALLDACFQASIPADPDFDRVVNGLYLPTEIERLRLYREPSGRLWAHARLHDKTPRWWRADIDIYDEEGRQVAEVRGLRSQRVAGAAEENLEELLYAYEWQPQPLAEKQLEPPGTWLIFADRGGMGEVLADRLRDEGASCTLIFAGGGLACREEGRYEIEPGCLEDMTGLLQRLLTPGQPPCRGIVHLWSLDAPAADGLPTAALEAAQEVGPYSVLALVQAWEKCGGEQAAPLVIVTQGAQSVGDMPEAVAVTQSPVLGLGRVIVNEYPRLRCKLVDLDPGDDDDSLVGLIQELRADDDEDEVAWRGGLRYVHRYVASRSEGADAALARRRQPYRLTIPRPGSPDELMPRALRRRPPGAGQVEIEVVAAGLNFSDVMKALGIYPGLEDGSVPLGAECSGRVVAVGPGVDEFRVGDEVLGIAPNAFASHVTTAAELVAHKPPGLSFAEAAALPIAFLTASYALDHLGQLGAGERVLIHAASGGVGLAAIQRARLAGAEVFATAGSDEKRDYLRRLGIEHVMNSRTLAFADEVLAATSGRGVDVVLSSLAGEALVRSFELLGEHGRFLEIGKRDIYANSRLGLRPFRKNLSFHAIDLDRMIRQRPALLGKMLRQLAEEVRAGRVTPLPVHVFPIADATEAFRLMQQTRHIGKIVLSLREPPAKVAAGEEPIELDAEAAYLVSGGLGGFGLAVARWLVERGARHLVLLGRRGIPSAEVRERISDLEKLGAEVTVERADVTREEDVARVLAGIRGRGRVLRGVLHAAMVLEDSLLLNLERERMQRVLAPKLNGTWNLHWLTQDSPLDFFVMFSSLSSVFGHAGQGSYAAANLFLDALAWYRRARGLPALTVNWGYLAEVGYLAERPQLGERLERQGVQGFTVRQALTLLDRAMQGQAIQVSVMKVDWSRWRGLGVTGRVSPRFAHLLRQHEAADQDSDSWLPTFDAVRAAAPEARRELLDMLLRDKLARVLGTTPERIDPDKPLINLGIDSLMAIELRNWIEQELQVNLPILQLMRSPSLARLTDHLLELLAGVEGEGRPADGREAALAHEEPERLLEKIEELAGEDVDALLATLLAEKQQDRSATS